MGKTFWMKTSDAGRRFVGDAPNLTTVSGAGGQGPAHRQLICSFSGRNYVVEREDDMLNVYLISAAPLPLAMTGDRAPVGAGSSWTRAA